MLSNAITKTKVSITPSERAIEFRNLLDKLEKDLPPGVSHIQVNDWIGNEAKAFNVHVYLNMGEVKSAIYGKRGTYFWYRPGSNTETLYPWNQNEVRPFKMNLISAALKRLFAAEPNIKVRRFNSPKLRQFYDSAIMKQVIIGYYMPYISFDINFTADADYYN